MTDNKTIIIGKIKGKSDVFWATIETIKYSGESRWRQCVKLTPSSTFTHIVTWEEIIKPYPYMVRKIQRVKTTCLVNLTYLEFLLHTKQLLKGKINIKKNEFNKLTKLNTESYIDWAVIEVIKKNPIPLEYNKKNNKIEIKFDINKNQKKVDITINQDNTFSIQGDINDLKEALRELIDFWK